MTLLISKEFGFSGGVSITDAGMVESRKEEAEGRGEDGDEGFEDSTKGTKALICVLS